MKLQWLKEILKMTQDDLKAANNIIENLRRDLDGNLQITNEQKIISDNNLK